jgi:uncharacterized membrane protein YphA (DoxX/SURF4 family)
MIYLFVLGRILLGGYFIMSGINHFKNLKMLSGYAQSKGVPMATTAVWFSGLMLLVGGLGIVLGAWIQLSVLLLVLFLLITTFQMHQYWKVEDQMAKMGERVNFMKNLALLGSLLMILMIPAPWAVSLVM